MHPLSARGASAWRPHGAPRLGMLALTVICALSGPAKALEPAEGEADAIQKCEQRICTMALSPKPAGEDFTCAVSKTWDRDTLKKGEDKAVKWGFGDARCAVDLDIKRADVIAALTRKEHTVEVPEHTVKCVVERDGKLRPVTAKLSPKLVFKNGKADKIWINLKDIDGPSNVKATVWMAANLEDSLGIFHKSMIKSVNKFLHQKCAQRYFADGRRKPDPKEAAKKAAEAKKAAAKKAAAAKANSATAAVPAKQAAKPAAPPSETGSTAPAKTTAPAQPLSAENK